MIKVVKIITIILILALAPCESFAGDKASIKLFFVKPLENKKPLNSCNNQSCKALLKLINNSKESIDFAIYGIGGQDAIFNALVEAKKRGIIVRGVTDVTIKGKNPYKDTEKLMDILKTVKTDYSETVKMDGNEKLLVQKGIMHNKFFVIDKSIVWTGSTNISSSCMTYNANNSLLISSKDLANLYSQEFNQMYEQEKFHQAKQIIPNNEHIKLKNGSFVSIYFSPEHKAIKQCILPLIESSQKRIYITMFYFTRNDIAQALVDAHKRGVEIKMIIDASGAQGSYSRHDILRKAEIPVKVENWGGKMHTKTALIDDKYLIVGSLNWTGAAENDNDENTVLIEDTNLMQQYETEFNKLWQSIPDKWLSGNPDPESPDSINSCSDGIDNDHDRNTDMSDFGCYNKDPQAKHPEFRTAPTD